MPQINTYRLLLSCCCVYLLSVLFVVFCRVLLQGVRLVCHWVRWWLASCWVLHSTPGCG